MVDLRVVDELNCINKLEAQTTLAVFVWDTTAFRPSGKPGSDCLSGKGKLSHHFMCDAMRAGRNRGFGHERYLKLRYWLLHGRQLGRAYQGSTRALYLDIAMRYKRQ